MALISKGIELYYVQPDSFTGELPVAGAQEVTGLGYLVPELQEIGEISGIGDGVARDKIEVTTLADDKHVYINGILADNEKAGVTFKFLFKPELFKFFKNIATAMSTRQAAGKEDEWLWRIRIPSGLTAEGAQAYTIFDMPATITNLVMDGAGVNAALTMSVTLTPYDEITIA